MKRTLLTNINFIQIEGLRLECHALLIESGEKGVFGEGITHKLRGFGTSGDAPIFTQWLTDGAFTLTVAESQTAMMFSGDKVLPLFSGGELAIDGRKYFIQIEDRNCPFDESDMTDADYDVIWETLSRKVEQYWDAPHMPRNSWGPPRKQVLAHV